VNPRVGYLEEFFPFCLKEARENSHFGVYQDNSSTKPLVQLSRGHSTNQSFAVVLVRASTLRNKAVSQEQQEASLLFGDELL